MRKGKTKWKRASVCLVLSLAVGCAGATPPTVTATADLPPLDNPGPLPAASSDEPAPSADVARGVAALEANDLATAKAAFQAALRANAKDADALYYLGALSEKAGDVAGAESSYKAALAARATHARAEENLSALYDDAQRFDEALALTATALAQHPKDGMLHLNAAIAYGGKKDQPSAVREFDAAVAASPRDATFRMLYGHWLAVLHQRDAAVTQLKAALPLSKDIGVVAAVGHDLHLLQAFPECVSALTQAIGLRDAAELRTERAACSIGLLDEAAALADLRAATTKEPTYAPAQYYLGNELVKAGDFAGAVAAYQAFLKLEPNGAPAKAVAEKLKAAKAKLH